TLALRWFRFNVVGALGIGVQLCSLAVFKDVLQLHYLEATALAVEFAVLHNFVWHCRFTWKDRPGGVLARLFRFHVGNGLISIAGNLALMRLLAGALGLHYLLANAISIAIRSLANFAASEWFVFRREASGPARHLSKVATANKS